MWCLLTCDTQDKFGIERGGTIVFAFAFAFCLYSIPGGSQDFVSRFRGPPVDLPVGKEQGGPILGRSLPKAKRLGAFKRHSASLSRT